MTAEAKKRPLGERIAGLDVQSSFRDIRDGIGSGGSYGALTAQDLAAALGMMHGKNKDGRRLVRAEAVLALETYYGSHLRHEHKLRAAWADESEHNSDDADERIRNRVACALAVREFAGCATTDMDEWGYLMHQKPAEFRRNVIRVLAWLEGQRDTGLDALRKILSESRAPLDKGPRICIIGQV